MLNYPKLSLPDVEETIAFRAVQRILVNDPVLKRVIRTWNTWDGDATDLSQPTPSTCPYLAIAPRPDGSQWEAEGMHSMPFTVGFTVAANGSNVDQITNLWGHVRRALWPRDAARMAVVRGLVVNANITHPTMTLAGYGVQVQDKGARVIVAQGHLRVLLLISTP
jgi:hypothetical protein